MPKKLFVTGYSLLCDIPASSRITTDPGGGAVAALAGALAAALAQMGAGLTVGRRSYQAVHEDIFAILDRANDFSQRLLDSVDEDQIVYGHVMLILQQRNEENEAFFAQAMEDAQRGGANCPCGQCGCWPRWPNWPSGWQHVGLKHAVADRPSGRVAVSCNFPCRSRLNVIANLRDVQDDKLRQRWVNEATRLATATDARVNALVAHVWRNSEANRTCGNTPEKPGERSKAVRAKEQRGGAAEGKTQLTFTALFFFP